MGVETIALFVADAVVVDGTDHIFLDVTTIFVSLFGDTIGVTTPLFVELRIVGAICGNGIVAADTILRVVSAHQIP